jgi:hypothetical protein
VVPLSSLIGVAIDKLADHFAGDHYTGPVSVRVQLCHVHAGWSSSWARMSFTEDLINRCKRLESLLKECGGRGRGLKLLTESISHKLDKQLKKELKHIGFIRNQVVHEHGYTFRGDADKLLATCDSAIERLSSKPARGWIEWFRDRLRGGVSSERANAGGVVSSLIAVLFATLSAISLSVLAFSEKPSWVPLLCGLLFGYLSLRSSPRKKK